MPIISSVLNNNQGLTHYAGIILSVEVKVERRPLCQHNNSAILPQNNYFFIRTVKIVKWGKIQAILKFYDAVIVSIKINTFDLLPVFLSQFEYL